MRTTVTINDDLLDQARRLIRSDSTSRLLEEGLRALIEREAALRLARLGGSQPDLHVPERRRPVAS